MTKESQGEDLIADFLEEKGIVFKRYVTINSLKEDDKFFREADFFLPRHKVYIEFLGQWNNPEHQKRYKQKMAVYHNNKIPCVYLWPDNLGTLDWILKRRITEVLLKYDKKWLLFNHELDKYTEKYGLSIIIFIALIYYMRNSKWVYLLIIILLYHLFITVKDSTLRIQKIKKSKWVSGKD